MRLVDRILRFWRVKKVAPFIREGSSLLDVGTYDGALFNLINKPLGRCVGIEPFPVTSVAPAHVNMIEGMFPDDLPDDQKFDAITLLAVVEHFDTTQLEALAVNCLDAVNPGGRVLITTPSMWIYRILRVLMFLRLVDGMSLDQEWKGDENLSYKVTRVFKNHGFSLEAEKSFQFGLNKVLVLTKSA